MGTCRRLESQDLKSLQSLFRPFSQNFVTFYVPDTVLPKNIVQSEERSPTIRSSYPDHHRVHRGHGVESRLALLFQTDTAARLCGSACVFTSSAIVEPSATAAQGAAAPQSLEGVANRALEDVLQEQISPSQTESIPASEPPLNMVPQTCFEATCVPESLVDSGAVNAFTGNDAAIPSSGCVRLGQTDVEGSSSSHLDLLSMVPETCLDDMELMQPPSQLPGSPLQFKPQRSSEDSQAFLSAPCMGHDSSNKDPQGTLIETRLPAVPVPAAVLPTADAAVTVAGATDGGGHAAGAPVGVRSDELSGHAALEAAGSMPSPEVQAGADPWLAGATVATVEVRPTSQLRPAPPPGYDFDLDAAPDPGFDAMPRLQVTQTGMSRACPGNVGRCVSGAGFGPQAANGAAFDYLLDEPTPPPKQLPKGTRLLRPGQRAPPPPVQPQPQQFMQKEQLALQGGAPPLGAQHALSVPLELLAASAVSPYQQRHVAEVEVKPLIHQQQQQPPQEQVGRNSLTHQGVQLASGRQGGLQSGQSHWLGPHQEDPQQHQHHMLLPLPQFPAETPTQMCHDGGGQVHYDQNNSYQQHNELQLQKYQRHFAHFQEKQPIHYHQQQEQQQRLHQQQHREIRTPWQEADSRIAHNHAHGCVREWEGNPQQLSSSRASAGAPHHSSSVPVVRSSYSLHAKVSDDSVSRRHLHSGSGACIVSQVPWQHSQQQQGPAGEHSAWRPPNPNLQPSLSPQYPMQQPNRNPQHCSPQQHHQHQHGKQQPGPHQHPHWLQHPPPETYPGRQLSQQPQAFHRQMAFAGASWVGPEITNGASTPPNGVPWRHWQHHKHKNPHVLPHQQLLQQQPSRSPRPAVAGQVTREPSPPLPTQQQNCTVSQQSLHCGERHQHQAGPFVSDLEACRVPLPSQQPQPSSQQPQNFPKPAPRQSWGQLPPHSSAVCGHPPALSSGPRQPLAAITVNAGSLPMAQASNFHASGFAAINASTRQPPSGPSSRLQQQQQWRHPPQNSLEDGDRQPIHQVPQHAGNPLPGTHANHQVAKSDQPLWTQQPPAAGSFPRTACRSTDAGAGPKPARITERPHPWEQSDAGSGCGFRTASDRPIHLSEAAQRRALAFWAKVMAEPDTEADGTIVRAEASGVEEAEKQQGRKEAQTGGQPFVLLGCERYQQPFSLPLEMEIPPTVPLEFFDEENETAGPSAAARPDLEAQNVVTGTTDGGMSVAQITAAYTPVVQSGCVDQPKEPNFDAGMDVGGGCGGFMFANGKRPQVSAAAKKRGAEVLAKALAAEAECLESFDAGAKGQVTSEDGGGATNSKQEHPTHPLPAVECTSSDTIANARVLHGDGCYEGVDITSASAAAGDTHVDTIGISLEARIEGRCGENGTGPSHHNASCIAPGVPLVCGFSTAGGKPLIPSEAARKRAAGWFAKMIGNDVGENDGATGKVNIRHTDIVPMDAPGSVRGAPGAQVAATVGAAVLQDRGPSGDTGPPGAIESGAGECRLTSFSTAYGKPVVVSEVARKRAAGGVSTILREDELKAADHAERVDTEQEAAGAGTGADIIVGFSSRDAIAGPSTSELTHSVGIGSKGGHGEDSTAAFNAGRATSALSGVGGFTTANGRPVVVSEAARRRAAIWMANTLSEELEQGDRATGGGVADDMRKGGDMLTNSDDVLTTVAVAPAQADRPTSPTGFAAVPKDQGGINPGAAMSGGFGGFSTGSGKPIVISQAARARAAGWLAKVFEDCADVDGCGGNVAAVRSASHVGGSKSAGHLEVEDSVMVTDAVAGEGAGKGADGKVTSTSAAAAVQAGPVGFSTSGGKPILVSEAARKRAEGWLAQKHASEDEEMDGDGAPATAAVHTACIVAKAPAAIARPGPTLRPPRNDSTSFKVPARLCVATPNSGAVTPEAFTSTAAAAALATVASEGINLAVVEGTSTSVVASGADVSSRPRGPHVAPITVSLPTSPLSDAPAPSRPPRKPETRRQGGIGPCNRAFSGAAVEQGDLRRRSLPAASVVALPPAATALPRSGITFASGKPVVLSEEARRSAAAWLERECEGQAVAQVATTVTIGDIQTVTALTKAATTAIATDRTGLAQATMVMYGERLTGGEASPVQPGEALKTAEAVAETAAVGPGIAAFGGGGNAGASPEGTARVVELDGTRASGNPAAKEVTGGLLASTDRDSTRTAADDNPQQERLHGQLTLGQRPLPLQKRPSNEEQQPSLAISSPESVLVGTAINSRAATSGDPADEVKQNQKQQRAVQTQPLSPITAVAEAAASDGGKEVRADAAPESLCCKAIGNSPRSGAGSGSENESPKRPLPALSNSTAATISPVPTSEGVGELEPGHGGGATGQASGPAATTTVQGTPLRSLPPTSAATAAAATPRVVVTPHKRLLATTPGTGLRLAPQLSTGGLKRPRPSVGTGLTYTSGRPPRTSGVAGAAAGAGSKRKFVSPLPVGYKGKPGTVDGGAPLRGAQGDSPASAGGAAGRCNSIMRRGGQGSPRRPRLSSLFDLEADTSGAITKLPLREYFALPPGSPAAGALYSPGPRHVEGSEVPEAPVEGCVSRSGAGPPGGGGGAAATMHDTDVVAAGAAAPSHFAPLTHAILDGVTAANAAEFRFWVSTTPSPPQPQAPQRDVYMMAESVNGACLAEADSGGGGGCSPRAETAAPASTSWVWGWWGAAEARAALHQLAVLPRSARERATDPWVSNHYRWIVWKLASYERRFPAHCRGRSLTPAAVLDQLRRRVQVELVGGGRPILAAILAHDRPAGLPMVLAISVVPELSGRSHFTEGMRVELTDGWYGIWAGLDGHLAQLVLSGRVAMGSKLRVSGADLQSERPGEPLDAATRGSSVLRLHYNGCSPAPWHAKLGAQVQPAALALRPLGQVIPGGGTVQATFLLVASKYGILTYENTPQGVVNRTPRAQEERLRSGAVQRSEAACAAAAAVQRAELDRCRGLLRGGPRAAAAFSSACSASFATLRVQRAYATMVVRSGGGLDGGGLEECTDAEGGAGGTLSAEEQAQMSRLVSERQAYMATEVDRLTEEAISGKPGSGGAGAGSGGGGGGGSDCGAPYLRLRVVGVTPHGVPSGPPCHAILRIWRPPAELDEQLREGQVLLVTNLMPGAYGSGASKDTAGGSAASLADLGPNGRLRCLELTAGKMTRFRILGQAADLSHQLALPGYQPRRQLRLADIAAALPAALQQRLMLPTHIAHGHGAGAAERDLLGALTGLFEFDFTGCVVRVGEVQMVSGGSAAAGAGSGSGGVRHQWLFLADQTSGLCAAGMPAMPGGGGGEGGSGGSSGCSGGLQPWMLAVKMLGTPDSVDFLSDPARQSGAVLCFRHLILQERDAANQLWVAAAPDTASVNRISPPLPLPPLGTSATGGAATTPVPRGADPVLTWARGPAGREQLALYGTKVDRLLGGSSV